MNKWLGIQATSPYVTIERLKELEADPIFDIENPNKVRSLIGAFTSNVRKFNAKDGSGYEYVIDKIIEIDKFNSHCSSRIATGFSHVRNLDEDRKKVVRKLFKKFNEQEMSEGLKEIVNKTISDM
jgi:aminopeptidase N